MQEQGHVVVAFKVSWQRWTVEIESEYVRLVKDVEQVFRKRATKLDGFVSQVVCRREADFSTRSYVERVSLKRHLRKLVAHRQLTSWITVG